jgi:hypothetical protein
MNRSHGWEILSSVLMLAFVAAPAFAENDGQEDLDKATQLKVTAETLDDLAEVIDRLETALEKGLDKSNEEFAEQLLVASLVQRGSLFTSALMSLSPDDPTVSHLGAQRPAACRRARQPGVGGLRDDWQGAGSRAR